MNNYTGIMSIGYDGDKFEAPTSLDDLLGSDFKGSVVLNGDPTQAGAAFAGVGMATVQRGGEQCGEIIARAHLAQTGHGQHRESRDGRR